MSTHYLDPHTEDILAGLPDRKDRKVIERMVNTHGRLIFAAESLLHGLNDPTRTFRFTYAQLLLIEQLRVVTREARGMKP